MTLPPKRSLCAAVIGSLVRFLRHKQTWDGSLLAIVKRILDRYGADLHIDSKLGQGTAFSCRFPSKVIQIVESIATGHPADGPRAIAGEEGIGRAAPPPEQYRNHDTTMTKP